MTGGFGNGSPRSRNTVDGSQWLYQRCCEDVEGRFPRLRDEGFFYFLRLMMAILDVQREAEHVGGETWVLVTPESMRPCLAIYFTFNESAGHIVMRAVHDL